MTPVVWTGLLREASGYSEEARSFVLALDRAGIPVVADPFARRPLSQRLSAAHATRIAALTGPPPRAFTHVLHWLPVVYYDAPGGGPQVERVCFERRPGAVRSIGRTMFETDLIPPEWVDVCNEMDEIWVPSTFNISSFSAAGVDPSKLFVVPSPLPLERYDRTPPPLALPGTRGFVFLSVFGWSLRKGWDLLVRAFVEEFAPDEPVSLVLKIAPALGSALPEQRAAIDTFIRSTLRRDPRRVPPITLIDVNLTPEEMVRLYRAANAFVLPSWGEAWGRPYMEAMAIGLPTIGTRASGQLDFMTDDNSYLIDCAVVDTPEPMWRQISVCVRAGAGGDLAAGQRRQKMAQPSVVHLRRLLRQVLTEREEAAEKGRRARQQVLERYSWPAVARIVRQRLEAGGPPRLPARRIAVSWEGPQFIHFGMASVSRELGVRLVESGRIHLSLLSDAGSDSDAAADPRFAPLLRCRGERRRPDVTVRHQWPPDWTPPRDGHWVLIQPWEFGSLPRSWIEPINEQVDEVWVPSRYVRQCFVDSGVDAERVVVLPHGVDVRRFRPDAPPLALPTRKRFRFLFVGGTLWRKGFDLLLQAYVGSFSAADDVCLVVKDFGVDSFYRGQGMRYAIEALRRDPRAPEILYLADDLPDAALPGLYTACDALVHPYRGEGFGLPIAEAMACCLAVIVTGAGPSLDFCDDTNSYRLPARPIVLADPRVAQLPTVSAPSMMEPDATALAERMREVLREPVEARARGARARDRIERDFTWEQAARAALQRIEALARRPIRRLTSSPSRRQLSVCMIVRNEAARLRAALASVAEVADELVVVDTGSSDATVAIAREFGARVFDFPWRDDWAAARNESLRHATKDWILVFDADQHLDCASGDELRRLIQTPDLIGYLPLYRSYVDAEGRSVVEHRSLRLFPNDPRLRYAGRIHEQVVARGDGPPFRHQACAILIHHHGYRPGVSDARAKAERDLPLLEREIGEQPDDPFPWFNLGVTYQQMRRHDEAVRALRHSIARCRGLGSEPVYLKNAHTALAVSLIERHRFDDAAQACRDAVAIDPGFADAHCTLAAAELRAGHLDAAFDAYARAFGRRRMPMLDGARDLAAATWKPLLGMGEIRLMQDRAEEAAAWLEQARGAHPTFAPIGTALAQAYLRLGRLDDAEVALRSALARGATEHVVPLLAEVLLRAGRPGEALELLQDATTRAPQDAAPHQALVRLLHALGDPQQAAAHAASLRRAAPSSPLGYLVEAALCRARGDLDAALERLARAQTLDDRNPSMLCDLGAVLLELGHPVESEQAYRLARRLRPEDDIARRGCLAAAAAADRVRSSAQPPTT